VFANKKLINFNHKLLSCRLDDWSGKKFAKIKVVDLPVCDVRSISQSAPWERVLDSRACRSKKVVF
jgi:hypothetical protein